MSNPFSSIDILVRPKIQISKSSKSSIPLSPTLLHFLVVVELDGLVDGRGYLHLHLLVLPAHSVQPLAPEIAILNLSFELVA